MTTKSPKILVTDLEFARIIGARVDEVRSAIKSGAYRTVRGKIDLVSACNVAAKQIREVAAGRAATEKDPETGETLDPVLEAALLKQALADATEMQRSLAEGRAVPRRQVDKVMGNWIVAAKNRLETLPTRAPRFAHGMSRALQNDLKELVRECLDILVKDGERAVKIIREKEKY